MSTNRKGGPLPGRLVDTGCFRRFLPVELEADLDLPGQDVLRRYLRREHAAEVGAVGGGVEIVAAAGVVVEEVERLKPKLARHAFVDLGALQDGCVQLVCMVLAD